MQWFISSCSMSDEVLEELEKIHRVLDLLLLKENKNMATLQDLDAAIAAENAELVDLGTAVSKVDSDIAALLAKIAAGLPPADVQTELTAIQNNSSSIATAVKNMNASDSTSHPTV